MSDCKISSGSFTLSFPALPGGGFGVCLARGEEARFVSAAPCGLYVKKSTAYPDAYQAAYACVEEKDGAVVAKAEIATKAGGRFAYTDIFRAEKADAFLLSRRVEVLAETPENAGFATRFSIAPAKTYTLEEVNCFAPGVWYQKNKFVPPHFMGYHKELRYHWMYETQYALPMFAVQDPETGDTVCLSRPKADVGMRDLKTRFHAQMVDETITFGSLGVSTVNGLTLDYIYPAARGTSTRPLPSGFALEPEYSNEYHPARVGYADEYSVAVDLTTEMDYAKLIRVLWRRVYARIGEPIIELDNEVLYKNCMKLLKAQTKKHGESWGLPFSSSLPSAEPMNVAYQFGFVGQQPNIGYQLIRYGVKENDAEALEKGRGVIGFWASTALSDFGAPHIWYNPELGKYEDRPFWVRMIGDGMEGILDAYVLLRKNGEEHPEWLEFCKAVGAWLVRAQNEDGSWYRSYDAKGEMLMESKANTSNVIRFLVQLYLVTKDEAIRTAAIRAGEWSLAHITKELEYRGGTCDNSDIYDKESGIYAIFAYLALYDLEKEQRWLDAAVAAADYTETWTYAWSFPVDVPFPNNPLSKRNISGQSLIATGHSGADVYMAACPYLYYRLYLLTDDKHYLEFARFLNKNTKQCTDWDGSFGYAYAGLCHESGGLSDQSFGGVYHWLPWCTYVQVDPISRLYDSFGAYEIEDIEKLPLEERKARNDIYKYFL